MWQQGALGKVVADLRGNVKGANNGLPYLANTNHDADGRIPVGDKPVDDGALPHNGV